MIKTFSHKGLKRLLERDDSRLIYPPTCSAFIKRLKRERRIARYPVFSYTAWTDPHS